MPRQKKTQSQQKPAGIEKCPTGIRGLDEWVVFPDHCVVNQIAARRSRVVQCRGSSHGS